MTLDPSYRLQVSWDGKHFLLYLRSLVDGVLPSTELPGFDFPRRQIKIRTPDLVVEIQAYQLDCQELFEFFQQDRFPAILGGDAIWLCSVVRWTLTLFKDGYWYPEVRSDGVIHLNPLLDAAAIRTQSQELEKNLPASLLASQIDPLKRKAWRDLVSSLTETIGWHLLGQEELQLPKLLSSQLPSQYEHLLNSLLAADKSVEHSCNFFDHRQANLTLKQRVSCLALKLVPPSDSESTWQLRPQLQSIAKPQLYVDALRAWAEPKSIPLELLPPKTSPRLHLLREFGRALRLFPVLGASLASSPPSPLLYSDQEMSQFLEENAEVLRSYGYELLAPPGLNQALVPDATLELKELGQSGLDLHQLLDFKWHLVVDETLLDPELLASWRDDPRALFHNGQRWLWLDPKKTLKLLRFVDKQPRRGTLLEAMQYASDMSSLRLQFGGGLAPLNHSYKFEEMAEPKQFQGQLRDYQRRGYSWLSFMNSLKLGACLADDMGLGKTVQTLALLCSLKERKELQPALLVCPTSVLGNWQREATRFAPELRVDIHHGDRPRDWESFRQNLDKTDVLLTSYALLTKDHKLFLEQNWQLIILDEAQQIKNPGSKVSKLSYKLRAASRLILTGTPVENRLQDLWTLFRFLQPELLGSKRRFQARFAIPIEKKGEEQARKQLRRLVGPFILRRTKMDPQVASELPARVITTVECSLTPEQARLYEYEVTQALESVEGLEGFQRKGAILRLLTRLKQLCDHPALLEDSPDWSAARSGKLHRLFEILKELSPEEGVLIFSQFTKMLGNLKLRLTELLGEEILMLDGSTPREHRDQMVERFQSGIGPRIFCISLKAGGVGLNLTRANSVIHFDRWWNPAVEAQATDRAHRIGQTRTVQVFKFVTQATLEEQIARILQEKQALMAELIEDGDTWLTELNDRELSELLLPPTREPSELAR